MQVLAITGYSGALDIAARRRFLAAADGELTVALQPIVDYATGRALAFESLARNVEALGHATPAEMFAEAERLGCLFEIDMMLAERGLEAFALIRRRGWAMLFLNLHGRLLWEGDRVRDHLSARIAHHGFAPADVCIELSEANQTLPIERMAAAVHGLRSPGFGIAVDDFGTGHSGLLMLYQSDPDFLKIDRFFIQSIPEDSKKRLLVGSIVELAHTLSIRVIAEGVETMAEMISCREIRCDLAQGYLIEEPRTDHAALSLSYPVPPRRKVASVRGSTVDLRSYVDPVQPIPADARLRDAFRIIQNAKEQVIIPVTDALGMPRGALREADVRPLLFSAFGRELVMNESLRLALADYVRPIPTVDVATPVGPLLDLISDHAADGVLVTEDMRYLGHLSSAALIQISNEMRLREASSQNPLSGLPGNEAILAAIADFAARDDRRLACYIDIDNFKPFNDRYGFEQGDRAILLCASELKGLRQDHGAFVGHVGGDDFFLSTAGPALEAVAWRLDDFPDRFAKAAEKLHSEADRRAGVIPGIARDGRKTDFPLLSCTVAILRLSSEDGQVPAEAISSRLANIKSRAKSRRCGILVEDWASGQSPEIDKAG